jgi:hypothetical protein
MSKKVLTPDDKVYDQAIKDHAIVDDTKSLEK